jgi:isopentenyl phosphate kinase
MSLHPSAPLTAPGLARCCVIKLGGSLITSFAPHDNATPELNHRQVIACANEIAESSQPVIVLHGTGTFGKPPALKYGYMDGRLGRERRAVVAEVSCHLAQMEASVLVCLQAAGLHPFRLPLVGLARCVGAGVKLTGMALVTDLLMRGMTPLIGGNFVLNEDGFIVYSSDNIAVDLAIAMQAESLVFATSAHGVYRNFGRDEEIFSHLCRSDVASIDAVDAAAHDVSGGMRRKIVTGLRAAQQGIPTFIVDGRIPGNLSRAISGTPLSGTQLRADAAFVPV